METPETRYALNGDVAIAYQVIGDGPHDLLLIPGFISNVELAWEEPGLAAWYRDLGSFCRLIVFDKRGTGLSDRFTGAPDLETRMDDARAVMDAAGSKNAAIVGYSDGSSLAALFATTYPERTTGLILYGSFFALELVVARRVEPQHERVVNAIAEIERRWGTPDYCDEQLAHDAPSKLGDDRFRRWYAMRLRMSASPAEAAALARMTMEIDTRALLPSIRIPTLIVHRTGDQYIHVKNARYAAEHIPRARYVELPGVDHLPWVGDSAAVVRAFREFLAQVWSSDLPGDTEPHRVLTTILFTDIVGSTAKAAELGDREWRGLLARHHDHVRAQLARFRGEELDTADGFFARFDGPARAIRCACAIKEAVSELGLDLRAGLHTGECELLDGKVVGLAVSIGARVAGEAAPGEMLVTQTVKDLVAGSGIQFEERGLAELKGVPGEWRLYAVADS
jgi:pimeloyl-ACP methyl ester carboxylesterase/class 3 adenylate cyclase